MTREDIEQLNVAEPYCFESDREEQWYSVGLKHGLDIADESPKSPWISVEEDLPYNHKELLIKSSDKRTTTKVVVIVTKDYAYSVNFMENDGTGWKWFCDVTDVAYWMTIPEIIEIKKVGD